MDHRFGGIERLYGKQDFQKIKQAHFCVIGLGGVGSWTVEALVRTGVGEITLVDFDDICVSNTSRQIHALTGSVGKMKTQFLKERAQKINPEVKVNIIEKAFSRETESEIFVFDYNGVVDAIDRSLTKLHLVMACRERKIPIVIAGSAAGRLNPSQIETKDLSKTSEDAMLAILRKDLRRQAGFPRQGSMGLPCVYSTEKPRYSDTEGCLTSDKPEGYNRPLDCATGMGTVTHMTGSFGFALSHLIIQKYLEN